MPSSFDARLVHWCQKNSVWFCRFSLFLIYFWFGILKVTGDSPATPLVQNLFEKTIPFMSFSLFLMLFGIFEIVIGVLFLIKGVERIALLLLFLHLITTVMPLVLLPAATWAGILIPTLEGQYIIKNILIIACAFVVGAHLDSRKKTE